MATIVVQNEWTLLGNTLESGLKKAKSGDTILLEEGTYVVGVLKISNNDVTIKSKGPKPSKIIGRIDVTETTKIENLVLYCNDDNVINCFGNCNVTLSNCLLSNGESEYPIIYGSKKAALDLYNCKIYDTKSTGVVLNEGAIANLSACEIWGCSTTAIKVQDSDTCITLKQCLLRDLNACGIWGHDKAKVYIENSEFKNFGESFAVAIIESNANINIVKSKIQNASGGGLILRDGASAEISDSEISGCGKTAISLKNINTALVLKSSIIRDSNCGGVWAEDQARIHIENSEFKNFGSDFGALGFGVNSIGNVLKTKIHSTAGNSLFVRDGAHIDIIDCEIWGCERVSILARDKNTILNIKNCIVRDTNLSGIFASLQSQVNIENSEIKNMGKNCSALIYAAGALGKVTKTKIFNIPGNALWQKEGAVIEMQQCEIGRCGGIVFHIEDINTKLGLSDCLISESLTKGVFVTKKAEANINSCEFTKCGAKDNQVLTAILEAKMTISNCKIHDTDDSAVYLSGGAFVSIIGSEIWNCQVSGIVAHESKTKLIITGCNIHNTRQFALDITNKVEIEVNDCIITDCGNTSPTRIDQTVSGIIENNKINQNINTNTNLVVQQNKKLSKEEIKEEIELSLRGLVAVEDFIKNFAFELNAFSEQITKSRGVVLWGNSSVGKTEIAQRICGVASDKNNPLNIPGLNFKYIPCCDMKVVPRDIVASVEDGTVLFLDEVDKYLSPNSGITDESTAKSLRSSLITNFNSKAILWIFTGTYADIRGTNNLTMDLLGKSLGTELASRVDFAGWKLKDWTLKSLIEAARGSALSSDINIEYDDDALCELCEYALKLGGGIRALERSHVAIKRMNQDLLNEKNEKIIFSKELILKLIEEENSES